MGFFTHNARIAGTVAMGLLRRRRTNPPAGLNMHIYKARAGLLDLDGYLHMNNAAYLTHAELARWNWFAYSGLLGFVARRKLLFLVTNSAITYRAPIGPWKPFDVTTEICGWDERSITLRHNFVVKSGRRAAQNLVSARIMDGATGELLAPGPVLAEIGVPSTVREQSPAEEAALARFAELNAALRETTSSRRDPPP